MLNRRDLWRLILTGVSLVFLAAAYLLVPEGGRIGLLAVMSALGVGAAMLWFPEVLVVGSLFAGRYAYDPRLGLADAPISVNQLMLGAIVALTIARRRQTMAALSQVSVRAMLGFVGVLIVWTMWTAAPVYGTEKVLRHVLLIVPAVIAGISVVRWRGGVSETLFTFWAFGLGLAIVATLTGSSDGSNRTTALGSGPIVFARSVGLAILICVLGMLAVARAQAIPRRLRWALGAAGALSVLIMLPSFVTAQSRGPVLAVLTMLGLSSLALSRGDLQRSVVIVIAAIAAIAIAATILDPMSGPSRFDPDNEWAASSARSRQGMIYEAFDTMLDNPLLGVGTGGWAVTATGIDHRYYPHNFFAEVAAEHGAIVCASLIVLLLGLPLLAVREWSRAPPCMERELLLITTAACGYTLITIQTSGDIVDNRSIWLMLGLMESARVFLQRRIVS